MFENVSVKFGEGNRYGLIGANGCGKSTFMKILGGDLEPSAGTVAIDRNERVGKLRQDQFAYEDERVLDVVLMGHEEMWQRDARARRDLRQSGRERRGLHARGRPGGASTPNSAATPPRRARANCCSAWASPTEQHNGPMSAVAPGWKLRVLLAQVLFGDPDILLLDEPTNNLDINSIRWLEDVLNARTSTMIIISHDRHFLYSVCTHMADVDYGDTPRLPGQLRRLHGGLDAGARSSCSTANAKAKDRIADLEDFVRRFRAHKSKARQATSRMKQIEKIKVEDVKPSSRQYPYIRFEVDEKEKLHRLAVEVKGLSKGYEQAAVQRPGSRHRSRREGRHHRPQRHRQDHAAALPVRAISSPMPAR